MPAPLTHDDYTDYVLNRTIYDLKGLTAEMEKSVRGGDAFDVEAARDCLERCVCSVGFIDVLNTPISRHG